MKKTRLYDFGFCLGVPKGKRVSEIVESIFLGVPYEFSPVVVHGAHTWFPDVARTRNRYFPTT